MTPQHKQLATPNRVLSTPFRSASAAATPMTNGQTPVSDAAATPVRDKLSINKDAGDLTLLTPRTAAERERQLSMRAELKSDLHTLPKPKKDYDIVVPDTEQEFEDVGVPDGFVEDAAEVEARRAAEAQAERERALRLESQVVQRRLPIPREISADLQVDDVIREEMLEMLRHDKNQRTVRPYESFDEAEIMAARALLADEAQALREEMNHGDVEALHRTLWHESLEDMWFIPAKGRFSRVSLASKKERVEALEQTFVTLRETMTKDNKKALKAEKKLDIRCGGYQSRATKVREAVAKLGQELVNTQVKLKTFEALRLKELQAVPARQGGLQAEVDVQLSREKGLQDRYQRLAEALQAVA